MARRLALDPEDVAPGGRRRHAQLLLDVLDSDDDDVGSLTVRVLRRQAPVRPPRRTGRGSTGGESPIYSAICSDFSGATEYSQGRQVPKRLPRSYVPYQAHHE